MRRAIAALALGWAVLLAAPAASADYLYDLWNGREHEKPYVLVIFDTSASMDETDEQGGSCPYGFDDRNGSGERDLYCSGSVLGVCLRWREEPCYQRIDAARDVLQRTLPRISTDVGLGMMTFEHKNDGGIIPPRNRSGRSNNMRDYCGVKTVASPPADYSTLENAIAAARPTANTPLEWSLDRAHETLRSIREAEGEGCREYYVILLTDGEDSCVGSDYDYLTAGVPAVESRVATLRADGIRTFVIGFGRDLTDTDGTSNLSRYARAGGTALNDDGDFVCWNDVGCGGDQTARAMFAYAADELDEALQRSFDEVRQGIFSAAEPVIASIPMRHSEIDRVSRNLMIYSAFEKEGDRMRGHLYGIRLFAEENEYAGDWQFTDLEDPAAVLENCSADETCVFDAGAMLQNRIDRKIYTGIPSTPLTDEGGFTVPVARLATLSNNDAGEDELRDAWQAFSALGPVADALQDDELPGDLSIPKATLRAPTEAIYEDTLSWLHGLSREWPLGDIYHGSVAITEPPAYGYRDRGYPQFRNEHRSRPWMIYTGANDGMIHAFYASPDFEQPENPRWEPGEEAWAYLPMNLVGRTMNEVQAGSERFFSQDLSCRYTDVILDDKVDAQGQLDCDDDPDCGWATILLCGQGWGGSWYVALDVTDPEEPKPLWEFTVPQGDDADDPVGLGRTWSVPAINLINLDGKPTWTALFGDGYNSDTADCPTWNSNNRKCTNSGSKASYRMLNLPFEGAWPIYGDGTTGDRGHAYLVDIASGRLMRLFHMHADQGKGQDLTSLVADVASIDSDGNGMIDASYLGGWDGSLARIAFGDKRTDSVADIGVCKAKNDVVVNMATSRPITSNPAVVPHPVRSDRIFLFVGSGVDEGLAPDQQNNNGNQWDFRAFQFDETGVPDDCIQVPNAGNLCKAGKTKFKLTGGARMLGQPLFSRQKTGRDWLVYTTWTPEDGACGGGGTARLWCLDVTNPTQCTYCGDMDGDAEHEYEQSTEVDTGGVPPSPPVVADGNVYVGPIRTPIVDDEGEAQPPNGGATRTVTISWREVF